MMEDRYLVLDYGGSAVKYALMNRNAEFLEEGERPAPRESVEAAVQTAHELKEQFAGQFKGVAVSLPGRINTDTGIAHTGGAYNFVKDTPFRDIYEEVYGVPVVLANDGKCAANAELHKGALKGINSGAVVLLGTGIAGGVIIDGRVWMGSTGGAGEFSYVMDNVPELMRYAFDYTGADRGPKSHTASWSGMGSVPGLLGIYCAKKGTEYVRGKPGQINGRDFFAAYDAGDPDAVLTLKEYGQVTACSIFSVQAVIDGEKYAIGGGISARPEVTQSVRTAMEDLFTMYRIAFSKPEIVTCQFRNEANLIGALMFYLERHPE